MLIFYHDFAGSASPDAKVNMWFKNLSGITSVKSFGATGSMNGRGGEAKKPQASRSSLAVRDSQTISLKDSIIFMTMSILIRIDRNLPIISPKTRAKIL